jgi:hypothetical protein
MMTSYQCSKHLVVFKAVLLMHLHDVISGGLVIHITFQLKIAS